MLEEPPVGVRLGVVELVDDDDVECVGSSWSIARCSDWIDAKTWSQSNRPLAADEPLAELWIVEDEPEDLLALLKDLVAMGDEEQPLVAGLRRRW